jgi:RNA polymerase sigma-70 factor (ECF subfamily)
MDSREFTEHYRAHLPAISKFFTYRTSVSEVEGLAAEVFSIAWQKRAKAPEGNELPWLYRIANNVLLNYRRKEQRRFVLPLLVTDLLAPSAESLAINNVTVKTAWSKLKPADRWVLSLIALEGLSVEEVSVALRVSKNAATIRYHRAKKNFSEIMKELES